jgi:hypothetical protein
VSTRRELEDRAAQLDARLTALALDERAPLATALERYLAFYRIWACELVPLIRAARRELSPELLLGARPSAVELTLVAARGEPRCRCRRASPAMSPGLGRGGPDRRATPASRCGRAARIAIENAQVRGASLHPAFRERSARGALIRRAG